MGPVATCEPTSGTLGCVLASQARGTLNSPKIIANAPALINVRYSFLARIRDCVFHKPENRGIFRLAEGSKLSAIDPAQGFRL